MREKIFYTQRTGNGNIPDSGIYEGVFKSFRTQSIRNKQQP